MRLIAKQGERFVEIFRINFYETKNVSVIGEYFLFSHLEALIPTGINFHSHFIYTDNGNYHFSIKYFDTSEKVYVDRKTFYNHIATRKGLSPQFDEHTPYERRNKISGNMLDMFMMGEPSKPWTARPFGHQFGGLSITSTPNQLLNMENIQNLEFKNDDIILDLNEYSGMNINFGACLFTKDNPSFDLKKINSDIVVIDKSIERNDLVLRIHVIITSN